MRLRATCALLLAAILLSVTCVSSACETSCGLEKAGAGCRNAGQSPTKHEHSARQMTGMRDCAMAKPDRLQNAEVAQITSPCDYSPCSSQAQVTVSEEGASAMELAPAYPTLIPATLIRPMSESYSKHIQSPPLRSPLLVSLQIAIRV